MLCATLTCMIPCEVEGVDTASLMWCLLLYRGTCQATESDTLMACLKGCSGLSCVCQQTHSMMHDECKLRLEPYCIAPTVLDDAYEA